ncbi:hypothetical protein [Rhodovulum sp. PH10]|uniref:hypothetical protein n=1 Tax=Rhodovulum sp. PH10 TaxID=1187851 RepID=UPI0012FCAA24|nr:hypothetical protein [Rhodovulum sp. PH10]
MDTTTLKNKKKRGQTLAGAAKTQEKRPEYDASRVRINTALLLENNEEENYNSRVNAGDLRADSKVDAHFEVPEEKTSNKFGETARVPIRKLPIEERRAYFAKKKRESNKRILAVPERKALRIEAERSNHRRNNKNYYEKIKSIPELYEARKAKKAHNERVRRARLRAQKQSAALGGYQP